MSSKPSFASLPPDALAKGVEEQGVERRELSVREERAVPAATCLICGSSRLATSQARDYVTGGAFAVRRCTSCGFGSTDSAPAAMDAFYPVRYRKYAGLTLAALRRLYSWRVRGWSRRLPAPGRALEIGCGDGWMLAALRDRGWRVLGSERSIDSARSAAALHGVTTFVGGLEALRDDARFRLIVLFQVLEHLADPLAVLRRGAELLEPGGVMLIAVPNFASWQARVFGRSWFHLDVPRHRSHFSPGALARAVEGVGLQVASTRFVSLEHDPYGWVQSALNRLGFEQNLLTRWLTGTADGDVTPASIGAMLAISGVLLVPSMALALCSWGARAGANMEMWAVKA